MKKLLLIAAVALVSPVLAQKKVKSPLDGRMYTLTLTEENKKKAEPFKDEIGFVAGKFKGTLLQNEGYGQAEYTYEVDSSSTPAVITFTVEAKNDSNGRFSWEGTISDDKIEGTATIRKKGKVEHTYKFTGTWKNKKKPRPAPKPAAPAAPADSTAAPADSTQSGQ